MPVEAAAPLWPAHHPLAMPTLTRLLRFLAANRPRLLGVTSVLIVIAIIRRRRAAALLAAGAGPSILRELSYSGFLRQLEGKGVATADVAPGLFKFRLTKDAAAKAAAEAAGAASTEATTAAASVALEATTFFTRPVSAPADTVDRMLRAGVDFQATQPTPSRVVPFLLAMLPVAYLGILLGVMYKLYGDNNGSAGKAAGTNAGGAEGGRAGLTFDDMAGADEAKASVMEVVDFLRNPEKYRALGARVPCGVLLAGPPGTGKTLLAKIIAAEAGLPFLYCTGSDFVEVFAGRGAARVRDLFKRAKKAAPCVLFFDELDALGKERSGGGDGVGNEEREQTLNQLLAAMDGFDTDEQSIVVIGATNRYEVLDDALVRPGRFDRVIKVGLPGAKGRAGILKVHLRGKRLDPAPEGAAGAIDVREIARVTGGFSGAALAHVVNEAAIGAVRGGRRHITQYDLLTAVQGYVLV